ncbi:unnamed protein product [Didymodactylos carnosus]|uniref:Uncharacterized protein n=1 Tax=Didymodactylos carnosus TaxID=1234261 RepID=A0A814J3E8_9BILA|nr:unnamed protein product [Didymodactylos carnosus]CAF1031402.1 unnamed protein product [Didymodactylos carnosus]CAF3701095.1 unnamed protein product [Didymodactylos carnosus]CAF3802227.1 unnamed protein product [Didymodactylos carnosus]
MYYPSRSRPEGWVLVRSFRKFEIKTVDAESLCNNISIEETTNIIYEKLYYKDLKLKLFILESYLNKFVVNENVLYSDNLCYYLKLRIYFDKENG